MRASSARACASRESSANNPSSAPCDCDFNTRWCCRSCAAVCAPASDAPSRSAEARTRGSARRLSLPPRTARDITTQFVLYRCSQMEMFRCNLSLETAEIGDFVRSDYMTERGSFWLGKRLQTSEYVARVPNLCGPAPSGTALVAPELRSWQG